MVEDGSAGHGRSPIYRRPTKVIAKYYNTLSEEAGVEEVRRPLVDHCSSLVRLRRRRRWKGRSVQFSGGPPAPAYDIGSDQLSSVDLVSRGAIQDRADRRRRGRPTPSSPVARSAGQVGDGEVCGGLEPAAAQTVNCCAFSCFSPPPLPWAQLQLLRLRPPVGAAGDDRRPRAARLQAGAGATAPAPTPLRRP